MSGKNISEDEVKLIIDAESAKAQQAIHELEKESRKLQEENKARLDQMLKLEAAGQITEGRYRRRKGIRGSGQRNLYNKLVWPIIYKRVFPELKYGLTDEVRHQLREQLKAALKG